MHAPTPLERTSTGILVGAALLVLTRPTASAQEPVAGPDARFGPTTATAQARFGHAIDGSAARALVGGYGDAQSGPDTGAAWICEPDPGTGAWTEVAKLVASDGAAGDQFGFAVALDGDRALIGAHGRDRAGAADAGAAYLFERAVDGGWNEVAQLAPDAPTPFAHAGWSVDLVGDRAVVGAVSDSAAGVFAGAVYVFERAADGSWPQVAQLVDPAGQFGDSLGHAVALDGERVVASALLDDDAADAAGAVHVFERANDGIWSHTAVLVAPNAVAGERLGRSLAVDGDWLVAGTWIDDGDDPGRAHLFERDAVSGAWVQRQVLEGPSGGTYFGFGVAADLAGDLCVVGARRINFGSTQPGLVRAYERRSDGLWHWIADVAPKDAGNLGRFGSALAIVGERRFLTGAHTADAPSQPLAGAAFDTRVANFMRTHAEVGIGEAGSTDLVLFAGPEYAGAFYFVAGSFTGTSPGLEVDGATIPLVWDAYTELTVFDQGGDLLAGNAGLLDDAGRASVHFELPKGLDPALVGLELFHAAVVVAAPTFWPPALVSEPVSIALAP